MATVSYLLDTDFLIDWLQDRPWARKLLSSSDHRLYCSSITRKELFGKPGLSDNERRRILRLLRRVRVLTLNQDIVAAASALLAKYGGSPLAVNDALIAATAQVKKLPLITRNRKHYEFIEEIELAKLP